MAKKAKITDLDPTVVSEVFTRRVAVLAMSGASNPTIAKELGISVSGVVAIQEMDTYKKHVTHAGEQEMGVALMRARGRLSAQIDKAGKVYEKVMDDYLSGATGARDAVVVAQSVHRAVGVDKDNGAAQDTSITVILPGGAEPVTFNADKVDE